MPVLVVALLAVLPALVIGSRIEGVLTLDANKKMVQPVPHVESTEGELYSHISTSNQYCIHDDSDTGSMSIGQQDCASMCDSMEGCAFISAWTTGGLHWCRRTKTCATRGTDGHQVIKIYTKESTSTTQPVETEVAVACEDTWVPSSNWLWWAVSPGVACQQWATNSQWGALGKHRSLIDACADESWARTHCAKTCNCMKAPAGFEFVGVGQCRTRHGRMPWIVAESTVASAGACAERCRADGSNKCRGYAYKHVTSRTSTEHICLLYNGDDSMVGSVNPGHKEYLCYAAEETGLRPRTAVVAGVEVDIYQASRDAPVVFVLHARLATRRQQEVRDYCYALQCRGYTAIAIDLMNHGSRLGDPLRQRGWAKGNLDAATDMFNQATRTAADVSKLIDALPEVFPDVSMTQGLGVLGEGLGGYVALMALAKEKRITLAVSLSGYGDFRTCMQSEYENMTESFKESNAWATLFTPALDTTVEEKGLLKSLGDFDGRPVLMLNGRLDKYKTCDTNFIAGLHKAQEESHTSREDQAERFRHFQYEDVGDTPVLEMKDVALDFIKEFMPATVTTHFQGPGVYKMYSYGQLQPLYAAAEKSYTGGQYAKVADDMCWNWKALWTFTQDPDGTYEVSNFAKAERLYSFDKYEDTGQNGPSWRFLKWGGKVLGQGADRWRVEDQGDGTYRLVNVRWGGALVNTQRMTEANGHFSHMVYVADKSGDGVDPQELWAFVKKA